MLGPLASEAGTQPSTKLHNATICDLHNATMRELHSATMCDMNVGDAGI